MLCVMYCMEPCHIKCFTVYPCSNGVVRYEPVMKLRKALDNLNKVKGLTHAEQGECGC